MGWTRNFKNIFTTKYIRNVGYNGFPSTSQESAYVFDDSHTSLIKSHEGVLKDFTRGGYHYPNTYLISPVRVDGFNFDTDISVSSAGNVLIVFGNSSAEESIDDYRIEHISSIVSRGNVVTNATTDIDGNLHISYTVSIENPTDVDITEYGLYIAELYYGTNSSNSAAMNVLIYRKKLDEPIHLTGGVPTNVIIDVIIPNPVMEY